MAVKYGQFRLPTKVAVEEKSDVQDQQHSSCFRRFVAEPFERGYGHTVGNSLRRIMMTSIEAYAIMSFLFEGVSQEFTAVEGVIEDMTHIILNIKGILIRKSDDVEHATRVKQLVKTLDISAADLEESGGKFAVCAKHMIDSPDFELVNPDHYLFTVTIPLTKRVSFKVGRGRGYVAAERHELVDRVVDEIVIDSAFSPVTQVNYFVENTRVGQDTDYDKLIMEVTTDGRVTPEEALVFSAQINVHHFSSFESLSFFEQISFDEDENEMDSDKDELLAKLSLKINEIELSVRSTNCLNQANVDTIAQLVVMPESEMLRFRNFGKKSLNEIKAKLEDMGLHLGMDLSSYGINATNVTEIVQEYLKEKSGQEA
ncbi:DNA-directed RNA polymerase subunit alpha [Candidatus Aerophobetes bacterium]|uniref:DNA-directed RNA polymerase subunit alpha n=1 Tax=Aerophobetes bacterium TaxID=2030807 RepID=A0A2A4X7C2_UNCAE|nr:MAG: DNA-directed RNA polymerase subunit alpha [Candidatus Aerophobetes bacterium]